MTADTVETTLNTNFTNLSVDNYNRLPPLPPLYHYLIWYNLLLIGFNQNNKNKLSWAIMIEKWLNK